MADSRDPEVDMHNGVLISLYKKGQPGILLAPEQVAKCVQFFLLEPRDVDGMPTTIATPYQGDMRGLKVNAIGGATGAGKTSLINIMAGGMETAPKLTSDTKCPCVYVFDLNGEKYALLDTAGLCDTAATAADDKETGNGLQELLINAVAATIKMYDLKMVTFLMCVSATDRLPGNFSDIWPEMQKALGGAELDTICRFVVTKANGETRIEKGKLAQLLKSDLWTDLQARGWPMCSAGRENLDRLTELIHPMSTKVVGIGGESVDADTQSIAHKQKVVAELEKSMQKATSRRATLIQSDADKKKQTEIDIREQQEKLNEAYEELASMGNCKEPEKKRLRCLIDGYRGELSILTQQLSEGVDSTESIQAHLVEIQSKLQKELDDIKQMHGFGKFFKSIAHGVASGVSNMVGGAASAVAT